MMGVTHNVPVAITQNDKIAVSDGQFRYSDTDPYVVAFEIQQPGYPKSDTVTWMVGRDLLAAGVCSKTPVGEGDMRVWRCDEGRGMHFELRSPQGRATLHVAADLVDSFLCQSYSIVAEGNETHYMDMDALVGRLLEGA